MDHDRSHEMLDACTDRAWLGGAFLCDERIADAVHPAKIGVTQELSLVARSGQTGRQ